jgi:hypothetical protein
MAVTKVCLTSALHFLCLVNLNKLHDVSGIQAEECLAQLPGLPASNTKAT